MDADSASDVDVTWQEVAEKPQRKGM